MEREKPYYALDKYLKETFGTKVYKLSLDAGLSCPNRDGKIDTRGCIFCSAGGSGEFALKIGTPAIGVFDNAIEQMKNAFREKEHPYIAYFQAFTNTYGDVDYLREVYTTALSLEQVAGISIATRADCITPEVLTLLDNLKNEFPDKFIWVELGLQTIHPDSIKYIRRGYDMNCFFQGFQALQKHKIPTVIHVILGLPNESTNDMMQTIDYINKLHPFGVKLQLLHVLKGTDLAKDYLDGKFETLSMEEYLELVVESICRLREDIVIHRVTGDGPKDITIAPVWCFRKTKTLNTFHHMLWDRNLSQGCHYTENDSLQFP